MSWAGTLNEGLSEQGPHAPRLLDASVDVLDADQLAVQSAKPAAVPLTSASKGDSNLIDRLDRLTPG